MMHSINLAKFLIFLFLFFSLSVQANSIHVVASRKALEKISHRSDIVLVASPGRSGSSMLTFLMIHYAQDYAVFKTHLLPPTAKFKGKILFIFSNPDLAAESVLHLTLKSKSFGYAHFHNNLDSANHAWLKKIGNTQNQTLENNLLAYDALGCHKQLQQWLHVRTQECTAGEAQILAIKFENLWDDETILALKNFIKLNDLTLPVKRERGYKEEDLRPKEAEFRQRYNLGTLEQPIYEAYDKARILWNNAPGFQYLKLGPALSNQKSKNRNKRHNKIINHHHLSELKGKN